MAFRVEQSGDIFIVKDRDTNRMVGSALTQEDARVIARAMLKEKRRKVGKKVSEE